MQRQFEQEECDRLTALAEWGWLVSPMATATNFSADERDSISENELAEIVARHRVLGVSEDEISSFVKRMRTSDIGLWHVEPHQQLISDAIVDAVAGRGPRLLAISMPPQHGKSTLITRRTSEWFLGNWPHKKVAIGGYNMEFAREWGYLIREDLKKHYSDLGFTLAEDSQKAAWWHTSEGGMLWTAGILSGATGKGSDLLILDDPIKNSAEAYNLLYRNRIWDEFQRTFLTRLQKGGVVIVVMTRWHTDDIIGRLMSPKYNDCINDWREIRMPAIWTRDEPEHYPAVRVYDKVTRVSKDYIRNKGEALCPNRFDLEALRMRRAMMNDETWLSLYQQIPLNETGKGQIYSNFQEAKHVSDLVRDDDLELFWSLDFNWNHMSSVIGQVRETFGPRAHLTNEKIIEIEVLDEICLNDSDTPEATEEFADRYALMNKRGQRPVVHLYGDVAGKQHSHAGPHMSDWELVRKGLRMRNIEFVDHVGSAPPAIRDSVNSMQMALKNSLGQTRLWISKKCKQLIADLTLVSWKRDSNGNATGRQDDSDEERTHMSDALRYMVHDKFKIRGRFGESEDSPR